LDVLVSRKDLTPAESREIDAAVSDFVQDRALDGVIAVVIVVGRGYQTVGYAKDAASVTASLLEWAKGNVQAHTAKSAN
jgi:hypothetical protein